MSESLNSSLAKARAQFQPIRRERTVTVRTKQGGTYEFSYAPLETILAAVTPALSSNGIALTQNIVDGKMVTTLSREGESISLAPIPVNFRDGMTMQEIGAMLTYASRYSLKVALVLATEDDNDAADPSNIYKVHQKGEDAQLPPRLNAAAKTLRECATMAALKAAWAAIPAADRAALSAVKDEAKAAIEMAEASAAEAA